MRANWKSLEWPGRVGELWTAGEEFGVAWEGGGSCGQHGEFGVAWDVFWTAGATNWGCLTFMELSSWGCGLISDGVGVLVACVGVVRCCWKQAHVNMHLPTSLPAAQLPSVPLGRAPGA